MTTNMWFVVCAAVLIIFLFVVFSPSFHPIKWIGALAVRAVVGIFLLFLLNVIGQSFDLHLPINIATTTVTAFLGIPGVAALVAIKYVIGF
ncbi:MAG: pro-sigmaK processing inhibitor BofA family protein [Sporolactobacillus sp.]